MYCLWWHHRSCFTPCASSSLQQTLCMYVCSLCMDSYDLIDSILTIMTMSVMVSLFSSADPCFIYGFVFVFHVPLCFLFYVVLSSFPPVWLPALPLFHLCWLPHLCLVTPSVNSICVSPLSLSDCLFLLSSCVTFLVLFCLFDQLVIKADFWFLFHFLVVSCFWVPLCKLDNEQTRTEIHQVTLALEAS